jgi:hypothetical protein
MEQGRKPLSDLEDKITKQLREHIAAQPADKRKEFIKSIQWKKVGGEFKPIFKEKVKDKTSLITSRAQLQPDDISSTAVGEKLSFNIPTINGFTNTSSVQLSIDTQNMAKELADELIAVKDRYIDELLMAIREKTPVGETGRARNGWTRINDNIINPVPYIKYIENGTLYNRPVGMIKTTVAESQRILDLAAGQVLSSY